MRVISTLSGGFEQLWREQNESQQAHVAASQEAQTAESLTAKLDGNWRISTRIEAAIRVHFVMFLHNNGVLPAQQPDQLDFLLAAACNRSPSSCPSPVSRNSCPTDTTVSPQQPEPG
jgi:hypothetical protein